MGTIKYGKLEIFCKVEYEPHTRHRVTHHTERVSHIQLELVNAEIARQDVRRHKRHVMSRAMLNAGMHRDSIGTPPVSGVAVKKKYYVKKQEECMHPFLLFTTWMHLETA